MMRKIHRWISFPLILFLFLVTATGVVLQGEELAEIGGSDAPRPTTSALPDDAALASAVQRAAGIARAAKADFPAQNVTFDFSKGEQKVRFGITPRGGPSIEVDLKSGAAKVQTAPKPSMHSIMIQLHTGRYFGPAGLIIMGLVSLIFLVLTVTGFMVYLNMWKRRRAAGSSGMFWN